MRGSGSRRRARRVVGTVLAATGLAAGGALAQDPDSTRVEWSGYVQLFGHAPREGDSRVELYTLGLGVDLETVGVGGRRLGFHGLVRVRDTELRDYYDTTVWAQEAYGWVDVPGGRLKLGKVYARGGRFWDGSFFGNVHYFDGLKLDPDFGVSYEGGWYAVQYLFDSDGLNGSLPDRDPETLEGVDERQQVRVRMAPLWRPVPGLEVGIGGSWARKELAGGGFRDDAVVDATVDGSIAWTFSGAGRAEGYAERSWREADAGQADRLDADYVLVGGRVQRHGVEVYYNYSRVDRPVGPREWIHQPGIAWSPAGPIRLLYEFDWWRESAAAGEERFFDRSHNVVLEMFF